ncbi:hypothetical protein QKU48_gp0477 [Fadolivirus algeromassiliense]|jgi:hypothetical protein|uniref:Uncharacterized protein n=1 Tax=Fadolivirus FV1/VV64 TaxID=3070911 RepID=A0A7D3V5E8_9VIRU|nr:hypothetical protein QKU48_gp0477 [Fadolivirus algeromassiliense]QKF93935.1 hypothetical protein Fadolivirus_1_477 [Fadolivirus FV1/VV64]
MATTTPTPVNLLQEGPVLIDPKEFMDPVQQAVYSKIPFGTPSPVGKATKAAQNKGEYYAQVWDTLTDDKKKELQAAAYLKAQQFNVNPKDVESTIRNAFFKIAHADVLAPEDAVKEDEKFFDVTLKEVIVRKADGKAYMLKNGKEISLDFDNADMLSHLKNSQCFSLGLGKDQCATVFECLVNGNLDKKCLDALKTNKDGFFAAAKDQISNIHPVLALRVLQQFGFKKYKDSLDGLWKVQSVNHWLNSTVKGKFNDADIKEIFRGDSRDVLNYINLVAEHVNANPAILNKGYSGSPSQKVAPEVPAYAKQLGIRYERPVTSENLFGYDALRLKTHLKLTRLQRPFTFASGAVSTPFGSTFGPAPMLQAVQTGGGSQCDYIIKKMNSNGNVTSGALIINYWKALEAGLARRGVKLNPTDTANLTKKIEQLQSVEKEVLRTLCFIDEFNTLKDAFPGMHTDDLLSESKLKMIVDRYDKVLSKQSTVENSILDAIIKIQDLVSSDVSLGGLKSFNTDV